MDLIILNFSQKTWTSELSLPSPNFRTTPPERCLATTYDLTCIRPTNTELQWNRVSNRYLTTWPPTLSQRFVKDIIQLDIMTCTHIKKVKWLNWKRRLDFADELKLR
ncbi:hypothetical protein AVEN_40908-1 [Araneus ventricosus]|uniref:Uncharacterized protein n=1 Tax=Araneus ventricosus TaxID=182803 RepID=A0A4Y2L501_ARAVE|nr:hypothetical protein AVEN_40908-1 [Araneus ventricosus]